MRVPYPSWLRICHPQPFSNLPPNLGQNTSHLLHLKMLLLTAEGLPSVSPVGFLYLPSTIQEKIIYVSIENLLVMF